jgi:serine/threonine protein kinase
MKPKSLFNKLKGFVSVSRKNCSYCGRPFTKKLWCKKCDPFRMIEGWTSGNNDVDKFIKDGIYEASFDIDTSVDDIFHDDYYNFSPSCLEWVPFNKFKNIKQIGEGGFSKVYSATWINGKSRYAKKYDGNWKKLGSKPMKVALKKLNGSKNISTEYLNEV